jgi:hypothetical protein
MYNRNDNYQMQMTQMNTLGTPNNMVAYDQMPINQMQTNPML